MKKRLRTWLEYGTWMLEGPRPWIVSFPRRCWCRMHFGGRMTPREVILHNEVVRELVGAV